MRKLILTDDPLPPRSRFSRFESKNRIKPPLLKS